MAAYKKNLILYYIYTFFSNVAVERGIFILFLIEQGLSNAQIGSDIWVTYAAYGVLLDIIGFANAIALTSVIPITSLCLVSLCFRLSKDAGGDIVC